VRDYSASEQEIRDFLARWDGQAIVDRLRNDWLLALGKTGNWAVFDEQYPKFVLNDDTQVKCFALNSRALKGANVADEARTLLSNPRITARLQRPDRDAGAEWPVQRCRRLVPDPPGRRERQCHRGPPRSRAGRQRRRQRDQVMDRPALMLAKGRAVVRRTTSFTSSRWAASPRPILPRPRPISTMPRAT
jgi:hypothetical protein